MPVLKGLRPFKLPYSTGTKLTGKNGQPLKYKSIAPFSVTAKDSSELALKYVMDLAIQQIWILGGDAAVRVKVVSSRDGFIFSATITGRAVKVIDSR